jgi:hypothetical protein
LPEGGFGVAIEIPFNVAPQGNQPTQPTEKASQTV